MTRYRAAWVVPIAGPPVRHGWVAVDGDRIVEVGTRPEPSGGKAERDLGDVALLPGLVNAHTHLELSYLRGRVAPTAEFVDWIGGVMAERARQTRATAPQIVGAVTEAIAEAVACGTAVVGDISNTLVTFEPLARSPLAAVVFHELIRFRGAEAEILVEDACRALEELPRTSSVRPSLAAHAPYSVAPVLFRQIRRAVDERRLGPCSVHLAESAAEVEFIRSAGGPWRALLERVGAWDASWAAPGVSPVQYLDEIGFLTGGVLAVHGVQMAPADLSRLAERGATLVTCPRSNAHTGAGVPPLERFYASGVNVAVGTDSLGSAPDLNVFAELAAMRALAPRVPAAALLDSATRQGARALGFDADYGTIEPGRRARLLAVDVSPGTSDVEEYLVSGIRPDRVRWIDGPEASRC